MYIIVTKRQKITKQNLTPALSLLRRGCRRRERCVIIEK